MREHNREPKRALRPSTHISSFLQGTYWPFCAINTAHLALSHCQSSLSRQIWHGNMCHSIQNAASGKGRLKEKLRNFSFLAVRTGQRLWREPGMRNITDTTSYTSYQTGPHVHCCFLMLRSTHFSTLSTCSCWEKSDRTFSASMHAPVTSAANAVHDENGTAILLIVVSFRCQHLW